MRLTGSRIAAAASLLSMTPLALAHHMEGGEAPTGVVAGLLSGLGHPLIGWDHALFLIAVGVLAVAAGAVRLVPAAFVLAATAGVAAQYAMPGLPVPPWLAPATVLVVATAMLLQPGANRGPWVALVTVAGLVHGQAYAGAIVGAEPTPLAAYLLGLATIQTALTVALAYGIRCLPAMASQSAGLLRATGAGILGVGALLLVVT